MADNIQNIKLGGTTYPVEDATAREIAETALSTANSALSTANTVKTDLNQIGTYLEDTTLLITDALSGNAQNILSELTLTEGKWMVIASAEINAHVSFSYNAGIKIVSGTAKGTYQWISTPHTSSDSWADFCCGNIINVTSDSAVVGNTITPYASDVYIGWSRIIALKL